MEYGLKSDWGTVTTKEQYQVYLQSDHWRNLRAAALARDHGRCRKCGTRFRLEVHHIIYRFPWTATVLEDLMTVCELHHRKIHQLLDAPKPPVVAVESTAPVAPGMVLGLKGWERAPVPPQPKPVLIGWTNKQFSKVQKVGKKALLAAARAKEKRRNKRNWKQNLKKHKKAAAKMKRQEAERRHNWLNRKHKLGWSF